MNIHHNARLTPLGRERTIRDVPPRPEGCSRRRKRYQRISKKRITSHLAYGKHREASPAARKCGPDHPCSNAVGYLIGSVRPSP